MPIDDEAYRTLLVADLTDRRARLAMYKREVDDRGPRSPKLLPMLLTLIELEEKAIPCIEAELESF